MIGYVTLGSSNVERSARLYDALMDNLDGVRAHSNDTVVAWEFGTSKTFLVLKAPFDAAPATSGNGTMVALTVADVATVDRLHALALKFGATDEGGPGFRGTTLYAGYFRDPDGNKLNVHCHVGENREAA